MFSEYERYQLKKQGLGKLQPVYSQYHPAYGMKRKYSALNSTSTQPRQLIRTNQNVRLPVDPVQIALNRQNAINRRLASQNRASMGFLGIEKKFYDTFLSGAAILAPSDCTGAEYDPSTTSMISTPATGDGEQNRDGKQIVCDYVEIKGAIHANGREGEANPPGACDIFIALVLGTQTNGARMNSEDCFKNTSNNAMSNATPLRNLLFGGRFRILKSEVINFDNMGVTQNGADNFCWSGLHKSFSWYVPLKGLKINFNAGTTSSVANVIDNSLHIIAFATSTVCAPLLTYNARLRFMG